MSKSFLEQQQELGREKVSTKWQMANVGTMGAIDVMINDITAQIITNTGEEIMRLAEGEKTPDDIPDWSKNAVIDTLKKHITDVTGVE